MSLFKVPQASLQTFLLCFDVQGGKEYYQHEWNSSYVSYSKYEYDGKAKKHLEVGIWVSQ